MPNRPAPLATTLSLAAVALLVAPATLGEAQARKDSVVLGMVLEPAPGLDPTAATKPVGTGPCPFGAGAKGSAITRAGGGAPRRRHLRHAALRRAAQPEAVPGRCALLVVRGGTEGKTILTINNKKPFDDARRKASASRSAAAWC